MVECPGSDSRGQEIRNRGQNERWIQDQACLEPMCAAAGPRTNSNQACLSTRPLLHVPQNEDCASCFRRCRAGRLRRPAQVRSPPEYPIHTPHALRPADLRCLRFPAEATLTMVDWFDAPPRTFCNHCMFAACLVPAARSVVAESIRLSVQSALKRALKWSIGCPLVLLGSVPLKKI